MQNLEQVFQALLGCGVLAQLVLFDVVNGLAQILALEMAVRSVVLVLRLALLQVGLCQSFQDRVLLRIVTVVDDPAGLQQMDGQVHPTVDLVSDSAPRRESLGGLGFGTGSLGGAHLLNFVSDFLLDDADIRSRLALALARADVLLDGTQELLLGEEALSFRIRSLEEQNQLIALFLRLLAIVGGRVDGLLKLVECDGGLLTELALLKVREEDFVEDHEALVDDELLFLLVSPQVLVEQALLLLLHASRPGRQNVLDRALFELIVTHAHLRPRKL